MEPLLMRTSRYRKAFTLVELLITLIVTGIILSAVTTLAFAMSSAGWASDDTAVRQAQLRQARLRIGELIHNCRLVCAAPGPGNDLVLWQDDTNGDGRINVGEIVYIERGDNLSILRLCQFAPTEVAPVTLSTLGAPTMKAYLVSKYAETYALLIPACTNVQFSFDTAPPFTRRLDISFGLSENGTTHQYEMTMALRARAEHVVKLIGTKFEIVSDDD
jgi:prepilin-type N-terminal cleavage/methylation domain-containing protein